MAPMVWTGLIVPPFRSRIRIQDQIRIRIRLQDGYMDQEHGSVLPGEDPDPLPCPHNPIKPEIGKYSKLNWLSKKSKLFFSHFVWNLRDTIAGGTVTSDYFSHFCFSKL